MKKVAFTYCVYLCTLVSSAASAIDGGEPAAGMPSANTALLQTVFGLGLVVGAIFFLAWLLKRLNLVGLNQSKKIHIITAIPLGTREKAILIDVKGQQLLLGVAPGRVSTLHVFESPIVDFPEKKDGQEERGEQEASVGAMNLEPAGHNKGQSRSIVSSLAASSASEFSRKLNTFLGVGNKS